MVDKSQISKSVSDNTARQEVFINPANVIADVSSQSRLNLSQYDGNGRAHLQDSSENGVRSAQIPVDSSGSSMNQV